MITFTSPLMERHYRKVEAPRTWADDWAEFARKRFRDDIITHSGREYAPILGGRFWVCAECGFWNEEHTPDCDLLFSPVCLVAATGEEPGIIGLPGGAS